MRKRLGRLLPWLVAVGVLAFMFSRVSVIDTLAAVSQAAWWTVPALAGITVVIFLADTFAIWRTFGWFLARLSYFEVMVVRGASYLLALINYAVGQGALVYFVHRSRGVPVMRGAAAVLLTMGINVLLLLILTTVGLFFAPQVPPALKTVVLVGHGGLVVYLALVVAKPRWLTSRAIFDVLANAGITGHLKVMAVRLPHLTSLIVFSYVSLRGFGVRVPVAQAILFLPVVYFIAVLPISPAGLGTSQAAMVYLFAQYAPGPNPKAMILACGLVAQAVGLGMQVLIGLGFFRNQIARDLTRVPAPSP
jgi:hypothetical protein